MPDLPGQRIQMSILKMEIGGGCRRIIWFFSGQEAGFEIREPRNEMLPTCSRGFDLQLYSGLIVN